MHFYTVSLFLCCLFVFTPKVLRGPLYSPEPLNFSSTFEQGECARLFRFVVTLFSRVRKIWVRVVN